MPDKLIDTENIIGFVCVIFKYYLKCLEFSPYQTHSKQSIFAIHLIQNEQKLLNHVVIGANFMVNS